VDFADLLKQRRMVRHYDLEPIPRETLERIVRTVRRAPSGGFSQGQRLVVVTNAETRARIAQILDEDGWVAQGREPWMSVAPAHIVVCAQEQDYHDRYNEADKLAVTGGVEIDWPAPFWFVDAGAAMMLLLLAAIDEGLAAGVYGVTVPEMQDFKDLLGIPDDVAVVAGVTIGRGRPDPNASRASSRMSQRRRSLDEVVRWERW
jgi:FMN reductase [NAD(P)H]